MNNSVFVLVPFIPFKCYCTSTPPPYHDNINSIYQPGLSLGEGHFDDQDFNTKEKILTKILRNKSGAVQIVKNFKSVWINCKGVQ